MSIPITLTVNGVARSLDVPPEAVLADVLRERLGLTGCNIGCDQGVCGACTVLADGVPVAACSAFAFALDGAAITTIEGLSEGILHPVQAAFAATGAVQCGFCTAGMILSTTALLARHPDPDEAMIRAWLGGNLCRCTGYARIIEAVQRAAAEMA
jgi:carbon-monoxide dehydrogenase small subunit